MLGGIGLLIGPIGPLTAKWKHNPAIQDERYLGTYAASLALPPMTSRKSEA